MSSSSSSSHATVTYTSISNDDDLSPWGFHLKDAYEPKAPEAAPQSPDQVPLLLVHALDYPDYLAPFDDDLLPAEDQPLPDFASPTALSPDYLSDSKPVEDDPGEDPEEDPVYYPSKEEEPLASADSASPIPNSVPSSEEKELFEKGETAATPPSPTSQHHIIPLSETRLYRERISIILEADMPPRKRARFATPPRRFEIGESSAAAAARQPGSTLARGIDYGFMTTLEEVRESVTNLASSHRLDSKEFHTRHQDAQDERAILQARTSTLERDRRYHR
ncbi:hypothetical protein Tco_1360116 [Tanacetum coccineum]